MVLRNNCCPFEKCYGRKPFLRKSGLLSHIRQVHPGQSIPAFGCSRTLTSWDPFILSNNTVVGEATNNKANTTSDNSQYNNNQDNDERERMSYYDNDDFYANEDCNNDMDIEKDHSEQIYTEGINECDSDLGSLQLLLLLSLLLLLVLSLLLMPLVC
nr:hypothetical protein [Mammaliicoccus vitulinus]